MGKFITSIDIGSSKTVVTVGQKLEDGIHILFWKAAPSDGVKYGEVSNITRCSRVLQNLINEAQEAIGEEITEACVSISGRKIMSEEQKVEIKRHMPGTAISTNEIRDITIGRYTSGEEGAAVLDVAPQKYDIDDQYNVEFDELEGMRGENLDASFKVFKGKANLVETRRQTLKSCNIRMNRTILSPVASARAVLTELERQKGVVTIDFGKDLTEICIVRNNTVRDVFVIPFAGESITKDIENVTDISHNWAETIKVRHGYCLEEICPENKILELINSDGDNEGDVDLLLLTRIIEARVSEVFDAVKYLVNQNRYAEKLAGGYVLTGGSAYLSYILPLAKTILGAKVRLAAPRYFIASDPECGAGDAGSATAVGLLLEQLDPVLSTSGIKKPEAPLESASTPEKGNDAGKSKGGKRDVDVDDLGQLEEDGHDSGISKGLFGILHRKGGKPGKSVTHQEMETKPEQPKPTEIQVKEVKEKPVKKSEPKSKPSDKWVGEFFGDGGNGNKA